MPSSTLNLDLVVSRPSGAAVVQDYLEGKAEAVHFFGGHFDDAAAWSAKVAEIDARFDRDARARAASAMWVPEGGDPTRLERFVDEGGYVVTTGQQPALFGGPLYSVYKALTAVRLAGALEARFGKPVLPLFWVASDDHDWDEANHTFLLDVDNEPYRPKLEARDPKVTPPLHRIPLGAEGVVLRDAFIGKLPQSDFSAPWVELLRRAVGDGATMPSSFRAILEALLAPYGMVFTDAANPALKDASLPLLLAELERAEAFESILGATSDALQAAGYGQQVALMEGGVNLFLEGGAGRERIHRDGDAFRLRTSGERLSAADIAARAAADPSTLSPNVLLRPVVESAVFPTLSYVAGPGETAYFAQLRDYFEAHGIRMPVIHPRLGATVMETKVRKVLEKFGLEVGDFARPFHELAGDIAKDEVPEAVRSAIGALRGTIAKGVGDLQDAVKAVDPTLKGPVQHVRAQAFGALDDVEKKIVQALKRENEIALVQLGKVQVHLFPEGKPQERVMNPFYYLTRYGRAFLDGLHEAFVVDPGADTRDPASPPG